MNTTTRLTPLICTRCGASTNEPHPRGWETFKPGKEVCADCIGKLLDSAFAAMRAYLATPQGQAQLERELNSEVQS